MIDARHISCPAHYARSSCCILDEALQHKRPMEGRPEDKKPGKYGISICSVFDLSDAR
jgi:hypothetical protein